MILIITNKDDVTTDFIINKLNKIGQAYYRLNTDTFLFEVDINFNIEKEEYILIDHQKKQEIDLSTVKSVYFRRPKLPKMKIKSLSRGEAEFINREITAVLEGIYRILKNLFWVNHVACIREAENKLYQLIIARKIGFEIPKSIITTMQNQANIFLRELQGKCIIKSIKNGNIDDPKCPKVVFTTLITDCDNNILDGVSDCPTYLQRNIEKIADVRVTVVGKKTFPAIIRSQEFQETKIDWRKGQNTKIKHERLKLPPEIETKCVELTNLLGLKFSAIDLVLDKNMRFIFLEINPNGQWGWIEKRLNYDISGEIVDLLIKGSNKHDIS